MIQWRHLVEAAGLGLWGGEGRGGEGRGEGRGGEGGEGRLGTQLGVF